MRLLVRGGVLRQGRSSSSSSSTFWPDIVFSDSWGFASEELTWFVVEKSFSLQTYRAENG